MPLDDGEPAADRLERLDGEPALVGPLARCDAVPRAERGVEVARILDSEVAQPRADPRLVDDPVPPVPFGQLDVRLQRRLDERWIGARPRDADEHSDVPALDETEPPRATCDLRQLPRLERPTLLAVELRRLGEEERLARQVDTVPEDVRRDADVRVAREEPVDLLAPRRQRHRAVEHGHAVGPEAVHLPCEREHRLAAERDEHGAGRERAELPGPDELQWQ